MSGLQRGQWAPNSSYGEDRSRHGSARITGGIYFALDEIAKKVRHPWAEDRMPIRGSVVVELISSQGDGDLNDEPSHSFYQHYHDGDLGKDKPFRSATSTRKRPSAVGIGAPDFLAHSF
ncbi:MAG: hypothetical protein JSW12_02360 [Deltaproteobacteria bacterium]|nr:MAG: hypothetical protein JSW12_02360 [Deltaproteobacteria bacterium]